MLTANNPEAPKAPVRFIQKERAYKPEAMVAQTMTHYATDGWLLHQESEDAKKQLDQHKVEEELQKKFMSEVKTATDSAGVLTLIVVMCVEGGNHCSREHLQCGAEKDCDDSKELRNQFNFSERAAQTSSLFPRDKETITEPPPTAGIGGTCSQSVIYDAYVQDQERIEHQERMAKMKAAAKKVLALGYCELITMDFSPSIQILCVFPGSCNEGGSWVHERECSK